MAKKNKATVFWGWAFVIAAAAIIGYAFYKTPAPSQPPPKGEEVAFTTIDQGTNSPVEVTDGNYIVRNLSEWEKLVPDSPAPVDFRREMIIASFMGERSTGGFGIEISHILQATNNILIKITQTSPGPNCFVTQAFTSPYHIVKITKLDLPVRFEVAEVVTKCE